MNQNFHNTINSFKSLAPESQRSFFLTLAKEKYLNEVLLEQLEEVIDLADCEERQNETSKDFNKLVQELIILTPSVAKQS